MPKKTKLNEGDLLAMPFGSVAEIRRPLVEVADSGFVHQCGRWEDFGDDEEIEIHKLCQICFLQVQGLLDGDLI